MGNSKNVVSAACFLFAKNENGEMCVLCGKRSGDDLLHYGGFFDVPCGVREYGEEPIDTAVRELKEEAGISISSSDLTFYGYQPWGGRSNKYGANFYALLDECIEIGQGDGEHDFFKWIPLKEVGNYLWAFYMNYIIFEIYQNIIVKQTLQEYLTRHCQLI